MDRGYLLVAEDLLRRRKACGWSASELARAVVDLAAEVGQDISLTQQAVSQFERKKLKSVPAWVRMADAALALNGQPEHVRAEELHRRFGRFTPLESAPAPDHLNEQPSWVSLRIPLPSETALAAMFEAQLRVFGDLRGAELARALAKRLPSGLVRLQAASPFAGADPDADVGATSASPLPTHPADLRVQRK